MLLAIPIAGGLTTLGQVAVPAIVLTVLVAVEVRAFRQPRDAIRHQAHATAAVPVPDGERR
jgi:hypothetical protein